MTLVAARGCKGTYLYLLGTQIVRVAHSFDDFGEATFTCVSASMEASSWLLGLVEPRRIVNRISHAVDAGDEMWRVMYIMHGYPTIVQNQPDTTYENE
jgi:hypothetical protein